MSNEYRTITIAWPKATHLVGCLCQAGLWSKLAIFVYQSSMDLKATLIPMAHIGYGETITIEIPKENAWLFACENGGNATSVVRTKNARLDANGPTAFEIRFHSWHILFGTGTTILLMIPTHWVPALKPLYFSLMGNETVETIVALWVILALAMFWPGNLFYLKPVGEQN